jgi:hypothetical protein
MSTSKPQSKFDWRFNIPGQLQPLVDLAPRLFEFARNPSKTLEVRDPPEALDDTWKFLVTYSIAFLFVATLISSPFQDALDLGTTERKIDLGFQRINEVGFYKSMLYLADKAGLIATLGLTAAIFARLVRRRADVSEFDAQAWRAYLFFSASVLFIPLVLFSQFARLFEVAPLAANDPSPLVWLVPAVGFLSYIVVQWIVIPLVLAKVLACKAGRVLWISWVSNMSASSIVLVTAFLFGTLVFGLTDFSLDQMKSDLIWRYPDIDQPDVFEPYKFPTQIEITSGKADDGEAVLLDENIDKLKRLVESLATNRAQKVRMLRLTSREVSAASAKDLVDFSQLTGSWTATSKTWLWLSARHVRVEDIECNVSASLIREGWRYRALIFVGNDKSFVPGSCAEALARAKR